jgi:hypothetical protein
MHLTVFSHGINCALVHGVNYELIRWHFIALRPDLTAMVKVLNGGHSIVPF